MTDNFKDYIYTIPALDERLKAPQTDREEAYLEHITTLVEKLKQDFATGLEHREQFVSTQKPEGVYIFIDGDNLKKINDITQDHSAGDSAIKAIANGIKLSLRPSDIGTEAARMGGDEFVIFVPNVDLEVGEKIAGRILENIRKQKINHPALEDWALTASIGVGYTKEDADKAMYNAKSKGRNRVEIAITSSEKKAIIRTKIFKLANKLQKLGHYKNSLILYKRLNNI